MRLRVFIPPEGRLSLSLPTGAGRLRSAAKVDEIEDREGFIKHRLA